MTREDFRQQIRDVLREFAKEGDLTKATNAISGIALNAIACGNMDCPKINLQVEIADDMPTSTELIDIDRGE